MCQRCGARTPVERKRRGRSSRRLGADQERRIERRYGPRKRGEYGDAVDHLGKVWKWQSKASRALPPKWLAAVSEPLLVDTLPGYVEDPLFGMRGLWDDHAAVVVRSYVRNGTATRDWLFVDAADAADWLGLPPRAGYYVVTGDWWLDHFGRDDPGG